MLLVLGSWVGARRLFHLSLFLTASRMDLIQYPRTVLAAGAATAAPAAQLRRGAMCVVANTAVVR